MLARVKERQNIIRSGKPISSMCNGLLYVMFKAGMPLKLPIRSISTLQQTHTSKLEIALGGTARKPEDVMALHDLGLDFAEISTKNLKQSNDNISKFVELVEGTSFYYLCHGPNEGDPNAMSSIRIDYLPRVEDILEIMPMLKMSLLTLHLWLDRRFVRSHIIDLKIEMLKKIVDKAREKNIVICLENLSEDWEDLDAVFRELPLLHLTLDVGQCTTLKKGKHCLRSHSSISR